MRIEFIKNIKDNPVNRYLAALFSAAIYDESDLKTLCKDLGFRYKIYNVDNHRAALCTNADFAIIPYCGTNDKDDLLTDANYIQRQIPGTDAMVHTGVDTAFNSLSLKMHSDIARQVNFGKFIIPTGHSLGGGIAARSTFGFNCRYGTCYTFGAPRVGNKAFGSGLRMWTVRVVNGQDIITHVPLPYMIVTGGNYRHKQDQLVEIDYTGKIHVGGRDRWTKIKGVANGIISDIVDRDAIPDNIEDHFMETGYLPPLKADCEAAK